MTDVDLEALLRTLHDALASSPTLEGESAELAALVRADLDRALGEERSLTPRLEAVIDRFEGKHPELVEATRRVVEQLAHLGI